MGLFKNGAGAVATSADAQGFGWQFFSPAPGGVTHYYAERALANGAKAIVTGPSTASLVTSIMQYENAQPGYKAGEAGKSSMNT